MENDQKICQCERYREVEKIIEYIERNCNKITEHTWKVYKEQILSHVEDAKALLADGGKEGDGKMVYAEKHTPHEDDVIIPISEWAEAGNMGFTSYNGTGYWMKNGFISKDEVFGTDPQDATHVIWYNK